MGASASSWPTTRRSASAEAAARLTSLRPGALNGRMQLATALPLHATSLLCFLAARAVDGVEEVGATTYRRSLRLTHGPAVIAADLGAMTWELKAGDERDRPEAEARVRALLDLD